MEKIQVLKRAKKWTFSLKLCQKRSFLDIYEKKKNDFKWKKSKFLVGVFSTEIMSEKMVFSYSGWKTNIVRTKN